MWHGYKDVKRDINKYLVILQLLGYSWKKEKVKKKKQQKKNNIEFEVIGGKGR